MYSTPMSVSMFVGWLVWETILVFNCHKVRNDRNEKQKYLSYSGWTNPEKILIKTS